MQRVTITETIPKGTMIHHPDQGFDLTLEELALHNFIETLKA